jgi:Tfp pilus assembly protein PilO
MKIRKFRPTVIAAAILILIIIGLSIAVLDQQLRSSNLSMQIMQENEKFNRLSRDTSADVNLDKKYRDMALKLGGRYKEVTWSRHIPFMVNQLTAAMQAYGVKIETLRPDPIRTMDNVSQLPLRIGFKAGIADMAKVVRDIEKTTPFLNIERLDIRAAGEKSDLLQSEMTVSSYAITDKDAPEMPKVTPLHSSASVKVTKNNLDIVKPNVNIKPLPMMAPQPGMNTNPSPFGSKQNPAATAPPPPSAQQGGGFDAIIKSLDKNGDGKISKEEAGGAPWFDRVDMNKDGAIDTNELETVKRFMGGAQGGGANGPGSNSMQPGGPQ